MNSARVAPPAASKYFRALQQATIPGDPDASLNNALRLAFHPTGFPSHTVYPAILDTAMKPQGKDSTLAGISTIRLIFMDSDYADLQIPTEELQRMSASKVLVPFLALMPEGGADLRTSAQVHKDRQESSK